MSKVSELYSDDLITALATYLLWSRFSSKPIDVSPQNLETYKDYYVALVYPYFCDAPELYGRGFPLLTRSSSLEYLYAITDNQGPGAVVRLGVVAYLDADECLKDQALLFLAAVSHLHPHSMAAVFAIADVIRNAKSLRSLQAVLDTAVSGALRGTEAAARTLLEFGMPILKHSNLSESLVRVWETEDPAQAIRADEHMVSSKFVAAVALLIAKRALFLANGNLLSTIVEQSYAIGGDPDTLCAVALSLVYAFRPTEVSTEITFALQKYGLDDEFKEGHN